VKLPALEGLQPYHRRVLAGAVPLQVFDALYAGERYAFLYESLEEHGGSGRYSFLGGKPRVVFRSRGRRIEIDTADEHIECEDDPVRCLRALVRSHTDAPPIATFPGGAVGYFGYDTVRFFEHLPDNNPDDIGHPDGFFLFPEEIIILDHLNEVAHILLYQTVDHERRADEIARILAACDEADNPTQPPIDDAPTDEPVAMTANMTREDFERSVDTAKDYIRAGDVFQVVLSQRFSFPMTSPPIDLYKALRITNPSPYMYYLKLDELSVLGSSPEVLVKLTGRRVSTRPLAGTRPRGDTPQHDDQLAIELVADHKERAEHIMLVDLARNDVGRVCRNGSVRVTDLLGVERYSKVMHLVSNVEGMLRDNCDAFDLLEAAFPAGTVSGAPKIRAMEIIDELEPTRRGIYAGAIGYFSFSGDMDVCIAIRTIVVDGRTGYIQAGAGIVADSIPHLEYQETINKAKGLTRAVQLAGRIARTESHSQ